jgi:hypothetical protein
MDSSGVTCFFFLKSTVFSAKTSNVVAAADDLFMHIDSRSCV